MTRAWITSTIQRCLLYLTAVKLTQTTSLNTTTPAEGAKLKISHWVFIRGKLTLAVMEGNLAEEWWNVIRSWSVTVLHVIVQSQYFYSQCNAKILLHLLYQQLTNNTQDLCVWTICYPSIWSVSVRLLLQEDCLPSMRVLLSGLRCWE